MKKISLLILTIFMSIIFAENVTIAVNDLKGKGLTEDELSILSERLRSELFKTDKYVVMARGEMNSILQEVEFQNSGACDDASCMVEVGRVLGVSKIVAGSVGKLGEFYTVSLRLIDVQTGKIDKSVDYDYSGTISKLVTKAMAEIALKLSSSQTAQVDEPEKIEVEDNSAPKKEKSKKRGVVTRIVSATVAVSALSGGLYANYKADQYNQQASDYYERVINGGDASALQASYESAINSSEQFTTIRNISYGVAGASVVLFGISFLF